MPVRKLLPLPALLLAGCLTSEKDAPPNPDCDFNFVSSKGLSWVGIDYLNHFHVQDIRIRTKVSATLSTRVFQAGSLIGNRLDTYDLTGLLSEPDSVDIHYGFVPEDANGNALPAGCYEVHVSIKAVEDSLYWISQSPDKRDSAWFRYFAKYEGPE